jgi:outer membrane protein assembly factor BamB
MKKFLAALALLLTVSVTARADDWPQWFGPQRDGVWRETGILDKFPEGGPKVRWRAPVGAGYSGPAVVGDKVFVTDRVLPEGANNPTNPFGKDRVPGKERILCLEESSGKLLWKHEYDCEYRISYASGPRTTPVVQGDKVYTLGAMGNLLCLEVANGNVVWSKDLVKEYGAPVPVWGFVGHPLLDGDRLVCLVGGEGSTLVAFDKNTGKEIWKSLSTPEVGYSPPMIFTIGGKRQLVIWHPESLNGLEPETGKPLWSVPFKARSALTAPTPVQDGDKLLVSSFYNGSMLVEFKDGPTKPNVVWKGKSSSERPKQTDGLHSIMPTPVIREGHIYGICSYGELRCLKEDTGERVWMTLKATGNATEPVERWANAFLTPQGDRCWLFNEKGDLIIAKLTPKGYEEISRAHIIEPTNTMVAGQRDPKNKNVVWSHPAYAHKCIYVRNDKELICVSLAAE